MLIKPQNIVKQHHMKDKGMFSFFLIHKIQKVAQKSCEIQ